MRKDRTTIVQYKWEYDYGFIVIVWSLEGGLKSLKKPERLASHDFH